MRKWYAVMALLVMACTVKAAPVTERMAKQKARAFVNEQFAKSGMEMKMAHKAMLPGKNDVPGLYVYNIGDNQGFVILSGDDRAVPVLAYSDTGSFDIDNAPDNVKWWMQYYTEALEQVVERQLVNRAAVSRPTDVIKPLVTTKWDQSEPYNQMCPSVNGTKAPTGYVATAMAQILNYHKWPQSTTNAIDAYTTYSYHVEMPKLEPTTFDWDHMANTYGRNATQVQKDAVAKLMLYCGQAVQMDYTPSSSGAQTMFLPQILVQSFNYPSTAHNINRYGYTIEQWDSLLLNELRNKRPVLYTGYTTASEGHAFVCDGYDGKGFYHINWGWGGTADG